MAYEISVGPAQLTINVGECVLTTETDGQIRQPSDRGLFVRDTRLISGWTVEVNGRPWDLLSSAATSHYAAQAVLTNPALPTDDGELPKHSISLTLSRTLGLGGMRETLALRNHNRTAARLVLTVHLRCDFADIFDVKAKRIVSRGGGGVAGGRARRPHAMPTSKASRRRPGPPSAPAATCRWSG